jgi:hypothetical protein
VSAADRVRDFLKVLASVDYPARSQQLAVAPQAMGYTHELNRYDLAALLAERDELALQVEQPRGQQGVYLTEEQLDAAYSLLGLGIDERRYDIHENHPYTEEEEAEALAKCDVAETVLTIIANAKENI